MRTENILFVGGIYDRAALSSLRRKSFAYIHGHEVGGTNPSLLESMSRATPIIALDVAFNREVAKKAGLYFRSQEELAEKLRRLESDPKSRKRMGSEARRIVQHEYSVTKVASRYADVVNTLMALRH
jgi:glycosyltransferase involved in cell wall biosynthesis